VGYQSTCSGRTQRHRCLDPLCCVESHSGKHFVSGLSKQRQWQSSEESVFESTLLRRNPHWILTQLSFTSPHVCLRTGHSRGRAKCFTKDCGAKPFICHIFQHRWTEQQHYNGYYYSIPSGIQRGHLRKWIAHKTIDNETKY
jgi:hypothetical protein